MFTEVVFVVYIQNMLTTVRMSLWGTSSQDGEPNGYAYPGGSMMLCFTMTVPDDKKVNFSLYQIIHNLDTIIRDGSSSGPPYSVYTKSNRGYFFPYVIMPSNLVSSSINCFTNAERNGNLIYLYTVTSSLLFNAGYLFDMNTSPLNGDRPNGRYSTDGFLKSTDGSSVESGEIYLNPHAYLTECVFKPIIADDKQDVYQGQDRNKSSVCVNYAFKRNGVLEHGTSGVYPFFANTGTDDRKIYTKFDIIVSSQNSSFSVDINGKVGIQE